MQFCSKYVVALLVFCVVFVPSVLFAAGIVPCDGVRCQACHLLELGQRLLYWFITIMGSVIMLVFAFAGFKMMMSQGSSEEISKAKSMMTNSIIGLIIMLGAWIFIDTLLKLLVDEKKLLGPWNELACVEQPEYAWSPVVDGSRGVSSDSPTDATLPAAVARVGTYQDQLCTLAANEGIADHCASLMAIMIQESGGNKDAESHAGAIGLMQVTPDAARSFDPSLAKKTDAEIRALLRDPSYNMRVAVAYYKEALNRYGASDFDSIYASYNGGFGATEPSRNCPGMERWQCEWDNDAHTKPNVGYKETRNYVNRVNQIRREYGS